MVSSPSPPDPYATAAAQTQSNEQTANYQQTLNNTSQITPYGSTTYNQTGTASDGAPEMTATTQLSQPVQDLVNSNLNNSQANSNLAGQLINSASGSLGGPAPVAGQLQNLHIGVNAIDNKLNQMQTATLDPQWQQLSNQTEQSLYDRGLTPGSEGYTQGEANFSNQRQQAYDTAYQGDAQQAAAQLEAMNASRNQNTEQNYQNAMTNYNAPLNALSALTSGSQVSQPGIGQTAPTDQTAVQGTNISGLIEQNYAQQVAQSNAAMGGLFGLGGTAISALGMFSDRRLKKDVSRLGTSPDGLPIYAWRYIWGGPLHAGFMAQDVREKYPEAVFEVGGYLAIDTTRL